MERSNVTRRIKMYMPKNSIVYIAVILFSGGVVANGWSAPPKGGGGGVGIPRFTVEFSNGKVLPLDLDAATHKDLIAKWNQASRISLTTTGTKVTYHIDTAQIILITEK